MADPGSIARLGRTSWSVLGIAGVVALVIVLIAVTRSVTVPLIVAAFLGVVFAPLVEILRKHMSRSAAAGLVLVLILVLTLGIAALITDAIADRSDEIGAGIREGVAELQDRLEGAIGAERLEDLRQSAASMQEEARDGAAAWIAQQIDTAAGFVGGAVLALIILFYLLSDFATVKSWLIRTLGNGHRADTERIVNESVSTVQRYFTGQAAIAAIDAVLIGVAAWIIGVPLAGTIGVVVFVTAFIPYLGAFLSGALAVLLALSTGDLWRTIAILAVILVVNNVVDNLVSPQIQGEAVGLHPLAILLSVAAGGAVAGVIGTILAVPITAIVVQGVRMAREADGPEESAEGVSPAGGLAEGAEP